jgi:hypothetical protein
MKKGIESIQWMPEGDGEAGWMVTLKEGFSFDPMSNDFTRWIPSDCREEIAELVIFNI